MMNITKPLTPKSIGNKPSTTTTTTTNTKPQHIHSTKPSTPKTFVQKNYPIKLYQSEIKVHNQSLSEYDLDIYDLMVDLIDTNKPNLSLYKQQPYLNFTIRLKLIDFLFKMSIRLKILPFVFFKAIKIFDRYCSKRIVLLDQSQLIITTCLWIASKVTGGNNHFVNINNLDKIGANNFKTINDLGYGSGGKFIGPTERFRLPKLNELVKLCGTKCKYDQGMFKQMEIHILNTLEWSLNDPTIEEFIINSHEFNVDCHNNNNNNSLGLNHPSDTYEFFKIKQYLSYVSLYSHELIDINIIELGQVIMDLINEVFKLSPNDKNYQTILNCDSNHPIKFDLSRYKYIKKSLIKSIFNSSDFMMKIFNSKGPQYLYQQINLQYKINHPPPPSTASNTPTTANHHPSTCTTTNNNNPIAFTNTTSVTNNNNTTHNSRSSSVSSDSSSTITNTPSTTPPPLVNTPLSNISTPPNHIHSTKKRSKSSSASPSLTFKYLHHHNHQPSIPPPQFHNSSNNNYQLVTPPHSAKNNTHHQIHNYIPPPHQLSSSSSCSTSSSSASSFSSSSSNANFFNSPNIQPPHSRFTPGGGINTGNSSNNGSARRYAFDATSINSKMTANTIATSSSSIFSNNTTFESNNDILDSNNNISVISKRYNSTLNPNNNTPLTDTESPVYTKTRLCKNILK